MPGRKLEEYRLTPAAQADLSGIWDYTAERWSPEQANAYILEIRKTLTMLLENPGLARERFELSPPVRVHRSGVHLIIYRIEPDYLSIIRIAHSREDWISAHSD